MGNKLSYDVAISGAGLNGMVAALALGGSATRTPLKIALIDQRDPINLNNNDERASAITETSRRIFEAMGIWPQLKLHAEPIREIIITDSPNSSDRPTLLKFDESHQPGGPSAYIIKNSHLIGVLYAEIQRHQNIEINIGSPIIDYQTKSSKVIINLSNNKLIHAKILLAADGKNSEIRTKANIESVGWAYDQSGIVTTIYHENPHEGRAEEHFRQAGPFAILPLPSKKSSLVWTEKTSVAQEILKLNEEAFEAQLAERLGTHLGNIKKIGQVTSWPLGLHLAKSFISDRVALIGDAAHVIHPIAGLGFNLGMRDVAALADIIFDAYRVGIDIGSRHVLEKYETARRPDTLKVAIATDGINRLFSNDYEIIRQVRDIGLKAVDKINPMKQFFMSEAAGLNDNLPRLMKGELA